MFARIFWERTDRAVMAAKAGPLMKLLEPYSNTFLYFWIATRALKLREIINDGDWVPPINGLVFHLTCNHTFACAVIWSPNHRRTVDIFESVETSGSQRLSNSTGWLILNLWGRERSLFNNASRGMESKNDSGYDDTGSFILVTVFKATDFRLIQWGVRTLRLHNRPFAVENFREGSIHYIQGSFNSTEFYFILHLMVFDCFGRLVLKFIYFNLSEGALIYLILKRAWVQRQWKGEIRSSASLQRQLYGAWPHTYTWHYPP